MIDKSVIVLALATVVTVASAAQEAKEAETVDRGSPTTASAIAATSGSLKAAHHPQALSWLRKVEKKHQTILKVEAQFTQTKHSTLFLEEIKSKGTLRYIKPNKLKIEYTEPGPLFNYIIDNTIVIVNPEIKQVERFHLMKEDAETQGISNMLLGFGASVTKLEKYFRIDLIEEGDEQIGILFVPWPDYKQQLFQRCRLFLSKKDLSPRSFDILDNEDDTTSVTIMMVRWNPDIPDAEFELDFPEDFEIINRN